jgi:predicted MFS family arabinose efflux permease
VTTVASARAPLDRRALGWATAALVLGVFAVGSEALVISPLLADIASDLDTSIDRAGLSVSVYGLAVALTAPAAGLVADRLSRRTTVLLGLAIFAAAGALCAASPGLAVLVTGRALCGLGAGLFLPAAYAWVGDEVPYANRARIMGRVVAGWAAALVLGVPLGGLVGQAAGWRESLALMAVLALASAMLAVRLLPAGSGAARREGGERPSLRGALAVPGIPLLLGINLLDMLGFYGVYTYLGSFLRDELDVRSGVAGALILLYGVGVAAISFNGRLLDRAGKVRALRWALAAMIAVFAALPWLGGAPVALGAGLVVMGVLQGGFLTCMTTLVTQVPPAARGSAVALMSCTTYIGVTLGAAIMGPIFDGPGYGLVGVLCAACMAVALALSMTIRADAAAPDPAG